ncbi:MAG: hypothetical protein ACI4WM_07085 [Erysipelotrichaceae bacterium]
MKMNNEQRESVVNAIKEVMGNELPDELMDAVSGGRLMNDVEFRNLLSNWYHYEQQHDQGKISDDTYNSLATAFKNYSDYIDSLDKDAETVLFDYERFK